MRWNRTFLSLAVLGLILFAAANILLMCSPNYFYEKLVLLTSGMLLSLTAVVFQVYFQRRKHASNGSEENEK